MLLIGLNVVYQKLNASEISSDHKLPDVGVIPGNGAVFDLDGNKICVVPKDYLIDTFVLLTTLIE